MKHKIQFMKSGGQPIAVSVIVGTVVSLLISILLTMGLTSLVMNGRVDENSTEVLVFFIRAVAAITGGLVASALAKEKHLIVIGVTMAAFLIILVGLGLVIYDESFNNFVSTAISIVVGGVCACIVRLKPPRKKKHSVRISK